MVWQGGDDKIAELLKQAYPPAAASPGFKAGLRQQVNQQAAALGAAARKPLWQQPFVWIPTAAASVVAAALIIFFVAFQSVPPTVTTGEATGVQTTSATLNGRLTRLGESASVDVSFEWGPTPSYGNETTPELRTETGDVTANLSDLRPNTTYHYRLKVVGREGTKYGPDMQFTTGLAQPVATTVGADKIQTTSATLRGRLDDLGSATSVAVSFEWGPTPSYGSDTTPVSMSTAAEYGADLGGLSPGTTYYFRAKAEGDGDPVYGIEKSFTTSMTAPSVSTGEAFDVATTSAILNGELSSLGTAGSIIASFEWGAAPGSYSQTTAGMAMSATGSFSAELSGLSPGTIYYYRAKAQGDGPPAYGEEKSFTTPTIPLSVTTKDATDVTTTASTLNGELTSLGTAESVTVSFEWGTAPGSYTQTTAGLARITTGTFSAELSGLTAGTIYYYRAKAYGDGLTVYGQENSFATATAPPSARTASATEVQCTSATLNGILDDLGAADNVQVSFEWGMTTDYGNETAPGMLAATGGFSANLKDLVPRTTYHFRAKAVGDGTAYGADMMFTTGQTLPEQATWYLSNDDPGCPRLMYEGDTSKDAKVVIVRDGHPLEWRADQASEGVTYPAGAWTVQLTLSQVDGDQQVVVEIGTWNGAIFEGQGVCSFIAYRDDVYAADLSTSSFTVSPGLYVAMKVSLPLEFDARIDVHVGQDSSWLKSPVYPEPLAPTVITSAAAGVAGTTAILNGYLNDLGSAGSVTVWFEWGRTTAYGNEVEVGHLTSDGSFSLALADLTPNTTYHFRAKAVGDGINYGIDMTFTTSP